MNASAETATNPHWPLNTCSSSPGILPIENATMYCSIAMMRTVIAAAEATSAILLARFNPYEGLAVFSPDFLGRSRLR